MGRTNRSEIISVYKYEPVSDYDKNDTLQRFSQVKIEATSFTISEPVVSMEITPLLYDLSTPSQKEVLESKYNIKPFSVLTISLERIFIDKLFAAESYFRRSANEANAFDATKHMYDLAVMMNQPKIINLLYNEYAMKKLLDIRTKEEMSRLDGIPGIAPSEFKFFRYATESPSIHYQYERMQNIYVINPKERINYDSLCISIRELEAMLNSNYSWKNYTIEKTNIEIDKSKIREDFER